MFIHVKFPTNVPGLGRVVAGQILALTGAEAIPLIAAGNAVPDPELDELKRRAREKGQNVDWDKDPKAPKRPRAGITASAGAYYPPADEPFAAKLSKAVKARASVNAMSRKQHDEYVERERKRWTRQRRARTKGE